jgi:hypothetical protein
VVVDSFNTSTLEQPKRLAPLGTIVWVCQVAQGIAGAPTVPLSGVAGAP